RGPLLRIDWLPIVVRIKNDRVRCAGCFPFAKNRGRNIFCLRFEQLRIESASLHHLDNKLRVAPNILTIGSYIRNREQARELIQDLSLVSTAIISNRRLSERDNHTSTNDHERLHKLENWNHDVVSLPGRSSTSGTKRPCD